MKEYYKYSAESTALVIPFVYIVCTLQRLCRVIGVHGIFQKFPRVLAGKMVKTRISVAGGIGLRACFRGKWE